MENLNRNNDFWLSLIFGALLLLVVSEAQAKTFKCTDQHGNNEFVMGVGDIVETVERENVFQGIKKKIFIKNVNKFDEVEDYLVKSETKNGKTYKITYSLNCEDI